MGCYGGPFGQGFYIDREGWNKIDGTFKFQSYRWDNKLIFWIIKYFEEVNKSTINSPLKY